ncbi:MAG: tRNA lysidine(34) synthetase TilS [Nitrospirota bacterium]
MTVLDTMKQTVEKYAMLSRGDRVLVALSGGPDSVCLLALLARIGAEYGIELSAAYIDHGLRPGETPREIAFCAELCTALKIPFFTRPVDVRAYAKERGINKQEAARELRYAALDGIALEHRSSTIALGHTADDQVETVVMRLIRGAGPSGLAGIPPKRGHFVRPLIEVERDEIERFLASEGIGFVVDSSNLAPDYLRNRLRQELVPFFKKVNPDVAGTIARTADIFREEERYFEVLVTKTLMRLISRKSDAAIELFLLPMEAMEKVLMRRVLRRAIDETRGLRGIGLVHIEEIMSLIKTGASGARIYLPHGIRVVKGYSTLLITAERPVKLPEYVLQSPGETVLPGEMILKEAALVVRSIEVAPREIPVDYGDDRRVAYLDAGKLAPPLTIRSRRPGDFFYPLGLGNRKKLQDFFVDEKIPRDARDSVPLLVSGGAIAWVMGCRIDDRFRIDKTTTRVLKFEIQPLKS